MVKTSALLAAAFIAASTLSDSASGHKDTTRRTLTNDKRKFFALNAKRGLEECSSSTSVRLLQERTATRRAEAVESLRQEMVRRRLDVTTAVATVHKSDKVVTTSTTSSDLFGADISAVLEPEVTYGPYYVLGELIRSDMTEDQEGVKMIIDVQVIDVSTCQPVTDMYVDFWHANATGVYSGVVADGNGDSTDTSNLNATFLRGVTPTDSDGVAQMTSIFPGHYSGRATHLHFIGNYGGTVLSNNTYSGASVVHVGQFFFDKALIDEVEATPPYSTNTQDFTGNGDDKWLTVAAVDGYDPIMNYAYLGDAVADGVFVWISLAVNMSAAQEVQEAATLTANGGVVSTNSVLGGGGSGFGGSKPGGSFPGAPPSSSSSSGPSTSSASSSGSTTTTTSNATTATASNAPSITSGSFAIAVVTLSACASLVLGML